MRKWTMLAAVSGIAFAATSPAAGQEVAEDDLTLEEEQQDARDEGALDVIVVTAQRRQESAQDVPIAISAFTSEELEARGVTQALDVAQYVPNLVGLNNTGLGSANAYYLRGLGNSESIATFDPPVGTYVDDIYLSRQNANNLQFFDVERVEVLRGPQGTLFGRNTTGGAINVILREPGDEFAGYVEGGYGAYDRIVGRASVDLPFNDDLAIKLSGFVNDDRGYVKNSPTDQFFNDSDGWGVRLGTRGEISPDARWTGSYAHIAANGENSLNFDCWPRDRSQCDGRFSTTGLAEDEFDRDGPLVGVLTGQKQFFGNGNRTDTDIISSNLEFGGEDLRVNIITGFVHLRQEFALDFADGRGLPSISNPFPPVQAFRFGGFTIANIGEHDQFTQEVKFTGDLADGFVQFVAGGYYFREWNRTDFGTVFTLGFVPGGFPFVLADRVLDNETEAWAGYAQADFNLTDALKLTAGVRYTDEEKTLSIRDNRPNLGGGLCLGSFGPVPCINNSNLVAPTGVAIPRELNSSLWTPRFVVNYEPVGEALLFASATRGFKSGGWNARATNPSLLLPFDPEKVWTYEGGVKTELFNRSIRINLVGYYTDVTDLQTPSAFVNESTGALTFITRNFADYTNKGVELEVQAVPAPGLNAFLAVGYQDDEYEVDEDDLAPDEFGVSSVAAGLQLCREQLAAGFVAGGGATACGQGIVAPDGSLATPVRTPDWTVAFGVNYEIDLTDRIVFWPAINASWRSEQETGTSELSIFDGEIFEPATGITYPANLAGDGDFIVGSRSESYWIVNGQLTLRFDNRYSISAECRNCLDQEAVQSSLANYSYLNQPRTWLVKARVEF